MPTDVVMPQMGESIAEGTIVRWIKQIGDPIELDEPLFEISTDKVDAEIPSPAAGILTAVRAAVGDTVPVDSVVAVIGQEGDVVEAVADSSESVARPTGAHTDEHTAEPSDVAPAASVGRSSEDDQEARRPAKSSPLVRRIAAEHHVDIAQVPGTGIGGRVSKRDIMAFIERGGTAAAAEEAVPGVPAATAAEPPASGFRPGERLEVVPMSVMRRRIAEHMVLSRRTSAHVHSVFDVDFSRVATLRASKVGEYAQAGVKLTYLAFIARAVLEALRAVPVINASIDGDSIVYKKDIHLGIAVALDNGLIVPVIPHADEKNVLGLSRAIADVADRARTKRLQPEEVHGGTFTITNPGSFGAAFGMPIINQPQVAILGVGALEKRPVVVNDAIAIRLRAYLTLGYDHRLIDGAVADQFMARVKHHLENFDEAAL